MRFFKAVAPTVIACLVSGGLAYATMYKWSQTPASNANSDSTINWAEGQPPSTVNDSARAMMAAIAKYADDLSGGNNITTGGPNAFAVSSKQVFDSLANMDRKKLCFVMQISNAAGGTTLNVDGLGAKALVADSATNLPAGSLVASRIYCAVYINAANEWRLDGFYGVTPSGTQMLAVSTNCPTGWTKLTSTHDFLPRIVNTTGGGVIGALGASTVFAQTTTGNVTLTQANLPAGVNLSAGSLTATLDPLTLNVRSGIQTGGVVDGAVTSTFTTGQNNTVLSSSTITIGGSIPLGGSSVAFNAPMDIRVAMMNTLICQKD